MNQIDRNLLLFLDPIGRYNQVSWDFYDGVVSGGKVFLLPERNVVLRFFREGLLKYYITSLMMFFFKNEKIRRVIFVNDGLLSSIFDSTNVSAYRAFAKKHLPKPKTLRQHIVALLPLVWRAETRFIVVYNAPLHLVNCDDSEISGLEANDFMFFSNAAGKLLLLTTQTLQAGRGELVKTTTDPDYVPVMTKEFDTVVQLSKRLGESGGLPEVGKHLETRGRNFFTEEYILGESLRERLHVLGRRGDFMRVCSILDSLDEWISGYHASFSGPKVPISSLYTHLFPMFSTCYGSNGMDLLKTGTKLLAQLNDASSGVIPVTAHNDLWPGNIVITTHGFIVIDWERATECRAPFFDYFWMVVATGIEALACRTGDFSKAARICLNGEGFVSKYAQQKLKRYIERLGITEKHFPNLMFLFLMELSVQGFQVLGRQTEVDRLAFAELVYYADSKCILHDAEQNLSASSLREYADA